MNLEQRTQLTVREWNAANILRCIHKKDEYQAVNILAGVTSGILHRSLRHVGQKRTTKKFRSDLGASIDAAIAELNALREAVGV